MGRKKTALLAAAALFGSCAAYLGLWPVPIDPVAWVPPPRAKLVVNQALAGGTLLHPELPGPEAIAFDGAGRIVTGLKDGRIVRFAADGSGDVEVLGHTGGRPLGVKVFGESVLIADSPKGLLLLEDGKITPLAPGHDGKPFKFADDLVVTQDATIYFTDASDRFTVKEFIYDVLEHRPRGRVLVFAPQTQRTAVIASGLYFANGLAMGPSGDYLVVAETTAYRLRKLWIAGEKKGRLEDFGPVLPGFPDNVTWSPERRVFWLAMGTPRDATIDGLAGRPFLRKVIARLPAAARPKPRRHTMVMAIDESGAVVHDLQLTGAKAYPLAASVIERDGWLYLGSFASPGVYRVAAPPLPAR